MRIVQGALNQLQKQHQRSLITDHSKKQSDEKVKYCENYWNVTDMKQVKCCWKNGAKRFAWLKVATNP